MATRDIGVEDQKIDPDRLEIGLRRLHHFRVEGVANIRDQHGNEIGTASPEALSERVRNIAKLGDRLMDALAQVRRHAVGVIEHMRHSGRRHSGTLGNFCDCGHRIRLRHCKSICKCFCKSIYLSIF